MPSFLSPVFGAGAQLFDNQGRVLSGGKLYTYVGGTTTPTATFTNNTDLVTNPNPIILDSAGRVPNEVWLEEGIATKFVLTDANNNVLGTWDNVEGVNDITTFVTAAEWQNVAGTPSYISSASFSIPGNLTTTFTTNRRLMLSVSAGTIYGYVVSSSFGGGITTVNVKPDSTALDSGLSQVMVGLLNASNPSVPQQYMAANAPVNVASNTTTLIGAALSVSVVITGTTTITAFDTIVSGVLRFAKFADVLTLTHSAGLVLPGAANITTAAGDHALFRSLGSGNWECVMYEEANRVVPEAIHATTATNVSGGTASVTSLTNTGATTLATSLTGLLRADAGVVSIGQPFLKFTAILASNPTFTPDARTTSMLIICIGGGGNGGNGAASSGGGGGGGSGGGVAIGTITSVSGTYNAVVGGAGADTSFGSITAKGGNAGANASFATGGLGGKTKGGGTAGAGYGSGEAGDIGGIQSGGDGGSTTTNSAGGGGGGGLPAIIYILGPGNGGQGALGSTHFDGTAATANSGCGGGGGGGLVTNDPPGSGGAGGSGVILVWEFE